MRDLIPWTRRYVVGHSPLDVMHRQMDDLLEEVLKDVGTARAPVAAMVSPNFELTETDEAIQVTAELPGMEEKDIEVSIEEDLLTVKGEKKQEREEKKKTCYFSERSFGRFQRVVQLPAGIDREKVKAQFKKGVLQITLPKTERAKTERKQIPITGE